MNKASFPLTSSGLSQFSRTKHHFPTLRKSLRFIPVILGIAALTLLTLAPAWAGDGALDPTFTNPAVKKIAIIRGQASYPSLSGYSIIFGHFTQVGATPCNSVARLDNTAR